MDKWWCVPAIALALVLATKLPFAIAQGGGYPIADKMAEKVIAHYQGASCEQIAVKKSQPPRAEEAQLKQRAVQLMREDAALRAHFINKVAGPVANKLFECEIIP